MTRRTPRLLAGIAAGVAALVALTSVPSAGQPVASAPDEGPVHVVTSNAAADPVAAAAGLAELMTLPSVPNGVTPGSRAPRETGANPCPKPRCLDVRVPVPSGVRVTSNKVRVLLPTGYGSRARARTRYPVIYLWNGALSDHTGYTFKTELIEMSKRWNAILVMPDGGSASRMGMMSDWHDGSYQWETYHTKVVVPWIDRRFRTKRGARGMVGVSMGTFGALNYAAHNPGMFKATLSVSGPVDNRAMKLASVDPTLNELLGVPPAQLRRIWGDPVLDADNWSRHNPAENVAALRGTKLFITSGTGSPNTASETGSSVHNGQVEQQIWETHRGFLTQLNLNQIPWTARVMVGGVHNWPYFNRPLRWGIPQVIRSIR